MNEVIQILIVNFVILMACMMVLWLSCTGSDTSQGERDQGLSRVAPKECLESKGYAYTTC